VAFADRILRARRRAAARRVYEEMLRGLPWARDPAGRPLEDAAWVLFQARFAVDRALHEAVDWAYDTLRDAGPPAPRTIRETMLLVELAGRHPQLFPDGPAAARRGGEGLAEAEVWAWIGAAVPDGLRAIGGEARLDARRVSRDLAAAIVGA
jgi:hypothetical protein